MLYSVPALNLFCVYWRDGALSVTELIRYVFSQVDTYTHRKIVHIEETPGPFL
jgi:hypothetical protein